jgi:hypothetical protein
MANSVSDMRFGINNVRQIAPANSSVLAVWRDYNGRSDCENVIKELQLGFALPTLCLRSFWATEAALSLATLTYNLTVLFQRHLGWQTKVTIQSLRFWLFITPGIIAYPPAKPRSNSPCPFANATGGRACGTKSSALFPTAMQSKIAPPSHPNLNAYCIGPAKRSHSSI